MVDVDPMGQVRRCPENPISYDGGNIYKLNNLLADGTTCKSENVIVSLVDTTRRSEHITSWFLFYCLFFKIAVVCDGQTILYHQKCSLLQ